MLVKSEFSGLWKKYREKNRKTEKIDTDPMKYGN